MKTTDSGHWTPETIDWQEIGADGTRYSLLEGRREQGTFSYAFLIPAGFWDPAHWHTQDARVFVASGVLWLGYGDRLDRSAMRAYRAGSFVLVPGGMRHFDGSDEETLIFGVASGPWSTHYVDPAHRPSAGTPSPV
jgi:hypothetical protein